MNNSFGQSNPHTQGLCSQTRSPRAQGRVWDSCYLLLSFMLPPAQTCTHLHLLTHSTHTHRYIHTPAYNFSQFMRILEKNFPEWNVWGWEEESTPVKS